MRAKIAKLINHFAFKRQFNSRAVKRAWKRMPRNKRVEMRRMMERDIE